MKFGKIKEILDHLLTLRTIYRYELFSGLINHLTAITLRDTIEGNNAHCTTFHFQGLERNTILIKE